MAHAQSEQGVAIPLASSATTVRTVNSKTSSTHRSKGNWLYIIAVPVLLIMILPYVYLLFQSFAPWDQVNKAFFPNALTLRSYQWILSGGGYTSLPLVNALLNSFLVTIVDSISVVVIGAVVGYALSILDFRGKRFINSFILFQMFYPAIILLVPTFLIIRFAGLYNTYWAMIIPKLVSLWAIFMYTSFFRSTPLELIEAARLDGANNFSIIFRIMIPMARSISTIIFLFVFMERWTELMWDIIVVKEPTRQTLNVLLSSMFGPYGAYPGPLYAAAALLTFPILLLFILFSRNFVNGVQLVLR
ncbi:carbohydrate ABC transporter permease [Ktedonobacter racemifer]|uniref:Binding-protein-dependent transport systems inner membrane component n=1 Tax=Ktedonobacter racemifer DSM 44963 TaxID=485913 RepID=D6U635_KTERA|nr:binding-protein-dependent transport systems inner membrane component [Ktedonobacter racemifer DSM 44963]